MNRREFIELVLKSAAIAALPASVLAGVRQNAENLVGNVKYHEYPRPEAFAFVCTLSVTVYSGGPFVGDTVYNISSLIDDKTTRSDRERIMAVYAIEDRRIGPLLHAALQESERC